ncbi:MAG: hypothetical protein ACOVOR_02160 [Rhabdochlamydiaceae bacterium]
MKLLFFITSLFCFGFLNCNSGQESLPGIYKDPAWKKYQDPDDQEDQIIKKGKSELSEAETKEKQKNARSLKEEKHEKK